MPQMGGTKMSSWFRPFEFKEYLTSLGKASKLET